MRNRKNQPISLDVFADIHPEKNRQQLMVAYLWYLVKNKRDHVYGVVGNHMPQTPADYCRVQLHG